MINHKSIDIEKIMDEIRADIASKGLVDDIPKFNDTVTPQGNFDMRTLEDAIENLFFLWNVPPYHEIRSRSGFIGCFIIFVKRIIRKCIGFHVTPHILEQNEFNKVILDSLVQIRNFIEVQNTMNEKNG